MVKFIHIYSIHIYTTLTSSIYILPIIYHEILILQAFFVYVVVQMGSSLFFLAFSKIQRIKCRVWFFSSKEVGVMLVNANDMAWRCTYSLYLYIFMRAKIRKKLFKTFDISTTGTLVELHIHFVWRCNSLNSYYA